MYMGKESGKQDGEKSKRNEKNFEGWGQMYMGKE